MDEQIIEISNGLKTYCLAVGAQCLAVCTTRDQSDISR